jgi:hypothetical protein
VGLKASTPLTQATPGRICAEAECFTFRVHATHKTNPRNQKEASSSSVEYAGSLDAESLVDDLSRILSLSKHRYGVKGAESRRIVPRRRKTRGGISSTTDFPSYLLLAPETGNPARGRVDPWLAQAPGPEGPEVKNSHQ